jgi:hypothetical protein
MYQSVAKFRHTYPADVSVVICGKGRWDEFAGEPVVRMWVFGAALDRKV